MSKSIKETTESEITIEKSTFKSILYHIDSVDEVKEILKDLNKEFYDATHIVYAYVLGDIMHSTDNGEPKGTAGVPTLEVLKKNDLNNVLAVTIRYFGGIKLGAGGLIRAYTESVVECIKNSQLTEEANVITFEIVFDYKNISFIDKKISKAIKVSKEFNDTVSYHITFKSEDYSRFLEELAPLGMNYLIRGEIIEKVYLWERY